MSGWRIPRHGWRWRLLGRVENAVWRWIDRKPERRRGRVERAWVSCVEPRRGQS